MEFNEIIERNYNATVRRGKITKHTNFIDFLDKIEEERQELADAFILQENYEYELADVILVCTSIAKHYNIDIQKALEEKTLYNEMRK